MIIMASSSTSTPFLPFFTPKSTPPTPQILPLKPFSFKPLHHRFSKTLIRSLDVSQEDKQEQPQPPMQEAASESSESPLDKRRLEEKFAVVNTGVYECRSCGYRYDEATGDPSYPIPPGLPFDRLPEDWRCATCGASKTFFESKRVEIAGFAQNQQFGFGGNSLTSGQKALLIYGAVRGAASSIVRVPTEVIKQRIQTGQFASAPDAVRLIVSREGFKGLFAARRNLNDPENAIVGALAGAITGAMMTPLDVIKTRLMVQGSAKQYKGIFHCVDTILREEGSSVFFRGMGPRVLWIGIGGCIFFSVLEKSKQVLSGRQQPLEES